MRIEINLASRPYQDLRRFYVVWGGGLALMILLTALLVTLAVFRLQEARQGWRLVEKKKDQIAKLEQQRDEAVRILNRPENRGTRDHSQFLNEAILRKSFAWTAVLADLEKIMPPRVHLVSITPELDKQHHLIVKMVVNGETREATVDVVKQLERSKHFRYPQYLREITGKEKGPEGGVRAEIQAYYRPGDVGTVSGEGE
jgi:type IV pilus assembly protein PilN